MIRMEVLQKMFQEKKREKTLIYAIIHASISHSYSDLLTDTDYINDINRYNRYIPTISKPSSHLSLSVLVFLV